MLVLDSEVDRNKETVGLSIAGNLAPHSNTVTLLVIYIMFGKLISVALSLSLSLSLNPMPSS